MITIVTVVRWFCFFVWKKKRCGFDWRFSDDWSCWAFFHVPTGPLFNFLEEQPGSCPLWLCLFCFPPGANKGFDLSTPSSVSLRSLTVTPTGVWCQITASDTKNQPRQPLASQGSWPQSIDSGAVGATWPKPGPWDCLWGAAPEAWAGGWLTQGAGGRYRGERPATLHERDRSWPTLLLLGGCWLFEMNSVCLGLLAQSLSRYPLLPIATRWKVKIKPGGLNHMRGCPRCCGVWSSIPAPPSWLMPGAPSSHDNYGHPQPRVPTSW